MTHLIVETRNVYGNECIYPVNNAAQALAAIAGTKTLRLADIRSACLSLGCTVALKNEPAGVIANAVSELANVASEHVAPPAPREVWAEGPRKGLSGRLMD